MAEDQQRFSHISVTTDDEDDVVIVAGAPARPHAEADSGSDLESDAALPPEPSSPSGCAAASSAPAEEAQKPPSRASRKPGAFEETTLEDLSESKMSTMQKAIIVVALVAIVAFVLYYMVLK